MHELSNLPIADGTIRAVICDGDDLILTVELADETCVRIRFIETQGYSVCSPVNEELSHITVDKELPSELVSDDDGAECCFAARFYSAWDDRRVVCAVAEAVEVADHS